MNNQECRARPKIININSNESLFYPCSIKMYKCSGSCNNVVSSKDGCINDTYAKLCFFNVVKDINVEVFYIMSRTNEKRYIGCHKACRCKRRLNASVCNNKQRWNKDKCRCECKELID